MYTISVINSTGEYTLHNPYDETLSVVDPKLDLEINKSGTLTFTIGPTNTNRAQIWPLASEIYVYRDDSVFWVGRPIEVEETFATMQEVTCEGVLGYLLDTQIPPFDFTGNKSITGASCVQTFLQRLITRHNSSLSTNWADQRKKFTLGTVTIYDSNNNLARSAEDYATTLETINDKLLETHGGYLRVRFSGSTRYIDYIDTFGEATQPITFGENLLDLSTHVKTEEIATSVIALGAQKENSDDRVTLTGYNPTQATRTKIADLSHGGALRTITGSGSFTGFTCIYDKQGEDSHGRIYTIQTWDDVTTQYNLALKAAEYIGTISVLGKTLDLSAVDLAQISVDYTSFGVGQMVRVVSVPHDVNAKYQLTQMSIDLYNPANSTMTLGGDLNTFTFDNTKKQAEIVTQLETGISDTVANATALLSGGLGGYLIIKQGESGQPYEILILNQSTEVASTYCVRMNENGIGFGRKASGQSAASWVYRNAWTIDGNLIADFITTGTLNANLIKAGILQDTGGNTSFNLSTGTFTMKKGSVNLGDGNFTVNNSGVLAIKKGSINLGSGAFTVTDAGVLTMKKGSINLGSGAFSVNTSGTLTMKQGSINLGSGKFTVSNAGAVKAVSGTIGGFTLGNRTLSASGTTYKFEINAPTSGGSEVFSAQVRPGTGWAWTDAMSIYGNGSARFQPMNMSSGIAGTLFEILPSSVYIIPGRSSSRGGNLYINDDGLLYAGVSGSSSRQIKHDIKPVENPELDPAKLYGLEVVQFKYNDDVFDDDPKHGQDLIGFILEDLAEIYPVATNMEGDEPKHWTWEPTLIIPPMLKLIQDQKKEIDDLTKRVEKLEAHIEKGAK